MSKGIRIIKPANKFDTNDQTKITLDTVREGGMKIDKVLYVPMDTYPYSETYQNSFGVDIGRIKYEHKLGYAPAFYGYVYAEPYQSTDGNTGLPINVQGQAYILPSVGPLGGPDIELYSDENFVYFDGLTRDPTQFAPSGVKSWIVAIIFQEKLDS